MIRANKHINLDLTTESLTSKAGQINLRYQKRIYDCTALIFYISKNVIYRKGSGP